MINQKRRKIIKKYLKIAFGQKERNKMVWLDPGPGWDWSNETGRKANKENKRKFFKAIKDAEPGRIKALAKKSKKALEEYIEEMEGYGCHEEADLARKALKRRPCCFRFLFFLFGGH